MLNKPYFKFAFLLIAISALLIGELPAKEKAAITPYPFTTCLVTGKDLTGKEDAVTYVHEGRQLRFWCNMCLGKFKKDPSTYLKKFDRAIAKSQLPLYPVNTCVVSGMKLGSMGEPIDYVHKNRLVRFCCKGCIPKFEKDPDQYLAKLDKAVTAKQKFGYPLKTCVISGMKLGNMGEPHEIIYANRLVRLCGKGCVTAFKKNPAKYLAKVDEARAKKEAQINKSKKRKKSSKKDCDSG